MAQKQQRRLEDEIYYSERVADDQYEYRFGHYFTILNRIISYEFQLILHYIPCLVMLFYQRS